jgi:hypothetical protein
MRIKINSTNPLVWPRGDMIGMCADPNHDQPCPLKHPDDVRLGIDGIGLILGTRLLDPLGGTPIVLRAVGEDHV